nr:hypothetical protein [Prauserella aidingensis]
MQHGVGADRIGDDVPSADRESSALGGIPGDLRADDLGWADPGGCHDGAGLVVEHHGAAEQLGQSVDQSSRSVLLGKRFEQVVLNADRAAEQVDVLREGRPVHHVDDFQERSLQRHGQHREVAAVRLVEERGRDRVHGQPDSEPQRRHAARVQFSDQVALLVGSADRAAEPGSGGEHQPSRLHPAGRVLDLDRVRAVDRSVGVTVGNQLEAELLFGQEIHQAETAVRRRRIVASFVCVHSLQPRCSHLTQLCQCDVDLIVCR